MFYQIIADLVEKGVGIVVISSEESELIGLCDRILVFREGEIVGEVYPVDDCEKRMMELMLGVDSKGA